MNKTKYKTIATSNYHKPQVQMKNPEQLREDLIDDLEAFEKDYLIRSIVCFLDHSQREELKDSIDREIF